MKNNIIKLTNKERYKEIKNYPHYFSVYILLIQTFLIFCGRFSIYTVFQPYVTRAFSVYIKAIE